MTDDDELWDLEVLQDARRLGDWMFDQFAPLVRGRAAEVGAGIGTFSERLLAHGVDDLLLVEPESLCASRLRRRFGARPGVEIAAETLPGSPALAARRGRVDVLLCQNVLEHIADDLGAMRAMAAALAPGGALALLVPAHPRLFGPLDRAYGHERRYTRGRLERLVGEAGLDLVRLYRFNALGVPGWIAKNRLSPRPRLDRRSIRAYEALVPLWRPVEERVKPPFGLSLIVHARRP